MTFSARAAGAVAQRIAHRDGFVLSRLLPDGTHSFRLTAVRTGPRGSTPVLVVPGGPGVASVLPFRGLRAAATRRGLDLIMVEHRGVGLSRRDSRGRDLPVEAVTVEAAADDLAAVLDATGTRRAVVYGSSYGSYLAQVFAVRHPQRVAAMVLDSPLLAVPDDLAASRAHRRHLFWDGTDPALAPVAAAVRDLAATGVDPAELAHVVEVTYEFAGPQALLGLLTARRAGRRLRTWRQVARLGSEQLTGGVPYVAEPDLVSGIAFGQLGFGLPLDGLPLDPQLHTASLATRRPVFLGEPYDLPAHLRALAVPLVVVSGERDLRTPPTVAERIVGLAPDAVLVTLRGTGHSALDSHQLAALHVAAASVAGTTHRLPALAGRLSALPRRGHSHWLGTALRAVTAGAGSGLPSGRRTAAPGRARRPA